MTNGRDAILGRVRLALGRGDAVSGDSGSSAAALRAAQAYVDAHARGPVPAIGDDVVARFVQRATDMESTVEAVDARGLVPQRVAAYLDTLAGDNARVRRGVCWPAFADLDWAACGLTMEARPAEGGDRLGVTGVFCAIAETGTLVVAAGATAPTATLLLPETHVAIVQRTQIVACMEDAFARVRDERGAMPRALNLVSGPSRTGDIEQTIVVGAHGPYRVHIIVVA